MIMLHDTTIDIKLVKNIGVRRASRGQFELRKFTLSVSAIHLFFFARH